MKIIATGARHTCHWMLRCSLLILVLAAVLITLLRLPLLGGFRTDLEQVIGDYLRVPVHIQELETGWQGWGPVLLLKGFSVLDPAVAAPLAHFERALVRLDLRRSLLANRPVLSNIRLEAVSLALEWGTDGRLRFIPQSVGRPPINLQKVVQWLLRTDSLDLVADELQLRQADASAEPMSFSELRLSVRGGGEQHLDLGLTLPETLGGQLQGALELRGEADDPTVWDANFYARLEGLELAALGSTPVVGQVTAELWGDWGRQGLNEVVGKARVRKLRSRTANPDELPDLSTEFSWQGEPGSWQLYSNWSGAGLGSAGDTLRMKAEGRGMAPMHLQGVAKDLTVEQIAALATPWLDRAQRELLAGLEPRGQVPELEFSLGCNEDNPSCRRGTGILAWKNYNITALVEGASSRAWRQFPSVADLDARVFLDQSGGLVRLNTFALRSEIGLLPAPFTVERGSGPVRWRLATTGLKLSSSGLNIANADFKASIRGDIALFGDGGSPLLDLNVEYRDIDVSRVRHYLPVSGLSPKLVAWLNRSLVEGQLSEGTLLFRGRAEDFPFNNEQGLFEARFQVNGATIDYRPGWPRIEALTGEVIFRNRSFTANASAARVSDTNLEHLHARMDNVKGGSLEIHSRVRTAGATLLRFLEESPLKVDVRRKVGMEVTGDNTLNLGLTLPFRGRPMQIKGQVDFAGGSVMLPNWDVDLRRIEGKLEFTEAGLKAEDLQLRFRGEPARLHLATAWRGGDDKIRIRLQGRLSPTALAGRYAAALKPYLDGKASWNMRLVMPRTRAGPPLELDLSSDLQGHMVKLPPPLGKASEERRSLQVQGRLDRKGRLQLWLNYGITTQAVLELDDALSEPRLSRGELRINAGEAALPQTSGLFVTAQLERFQLPPLAMNTRGIPPWLNTVNARFGELRLQGQRFRNVNLQLQREVDHAAVRLAGEDLSGRLHIPLRPSAEFPLRVELDRLALAPGTGPSAGQPAATPLDPRVLPPLRLDVKELVYDDKPLGHLQMTTIAQPQGLAFNAMTLRSDLHQVIASGEWRVTDSGQKSRLQATLYSQQLGKALQALGYDTGLKQGETQMEVTLDWPAGFTRFAPDLLDGKLSLRVGKGRLENLSPGVGRMFGLINFSSVSRRLSLDFSDLFEKGLGFDAIDGNVSFNNGDAYIEDLILKGPSVQIHTSGRLGIKKRDLEQTVTVTPKVSSALPIAGAIAGGPVIGVALFAAERLLGGGLDHVVRHQYKATGSWDSPVVERIGSVADADEKPYYTTNR